MWSLYIFCTVLTLITIIFSVSAESESITFPKCCPKNQSLVKHTNNIDTVGAQFECVDLNSAKERYNVSVFSGISVSDGVSLLFGIPDNCSELTITSTHRANLEIDGEDNICYDKMIAEFSNQTAQYIPQTVALTCDEPENASRIVFRLDHIKKCCPEGQAYDTDNHKCRNIIATNSIDELLGRLKLNVKHNSVYDVDIGLQCKLDEYVVELIEGQMEFSVTGSMLDVKGKANVSSGEWCVDRQYTSAALVARVCTSDCAQYGAYCLKKCCPFGQHYKPFGCNSFKSICVPDDQRILYDISDYLDQLRDDFDNIADVVGLGIGIKCEAGKFGLNRSSEDDYHWLTRDHKLMGGKFEYDKFCFETFDWSNCPQRDYQVSALACFIPDPDSGKSFRYSAMAMILSAIFLMITAIVYCALPELRNLHGKAVICHASTMFFGYSCLARVQMHKVANPKLCIFLGYGIYFGFVAAFFWLNVMCFDIWWTFGSIRTVQTIRRSSADRKKLLWYSLYAWGVTLLLTVVMYLLDVHHVSDFLDANIGWNHCWFSSVQNTYTDWPHYIFFVIPMGLVTSVNLVLWILTARHCARVKSEVHRLQSGSIGERVKKRFRIDRAKYVLTGKLWIVMGAGWISELLSTLFREPPWLWAVVDLINTLQGVFIFLLLVFKPKVYFLIKKRLGLVKPVQQNGTSSGRTSSTFLSRTISSDERVALRVSQPSNDVKRV